MRRGSFVLPLILIAVGALILAHNLGYDLSLVEMAAVYWPFLLIAWGGLRLFEILVAAGRSQPLPRSGVSGGEWVLVILICIIGSGTHYAREQWPRTRITMHGLEVFGEAFDFPVSGRHEAGAAPRVFIENLRGNVRVVGGDTHEVTVEGRTTVRAFDAEEAEEANRESPLEIVEQGDQIVIRTNHERVEGSSRVATDLEITVPKGASVESRGRSGDFDIANLDGNVTIESENAGVRLTEIGGDARVDLRRSDIIRIVNLEGTVDLSGRGRDVELERIAGQVTIRGSYSGELTLRELARPLVFESRRTNLRVERTPGRIRMALGDLTAENLVGPVTLTTSSRDVHITSFTGPLSLDIDHGDVELRPETADPDPINVELRAGDIVLAMPEGADFAIDATTERGEAINEYGGRVSIESIDDKGARMSGPPGASANVTLKTDRGDIVLRRTSGGVSQPSQSTGADSTSLDVEQH
jgi:hypothetical protein